MNTDTWIRAAARLLLGCVLLAGCGGAESPTDGNPSPAADSAATAIAETVRAAALPLSGAAGDYDPLLELVGDARVVLLGEATHGTHEFYRERARITQRLIAEKGFTAVAVEADWPRAYRVNRFVRGSGTDANAARALGSFTEFPTWMWRNAEVRDLAAWLRAHNEALPGSAEEVGFYGLDLYSLFLSADAVVEYLSQTDPDAAGRARERYACFRRFRDDPQAYGQAVEFNNAPSCEQQVAEQLQEMEARAAAAPQNAGEAADELFNAVQNARVVKNAEAYYRGMFRRGISTWNLRDQHWAESLDALMEHLSRNGEPAKVVVWAHNSHVGDARATHMGDQGEWNIGQLARQRYGDDAVLVGFTTHTGTVIAASEWGAPPQRKQVRPSMPESYEAIFHRTGMPSFLLPLRGGPAAEALAPARLERAIGVIYLPQSERASHYFHARLPEQFDAVIHWDETRAVDPL